MENEKYVTFFGGGQNKRETSEYAETVLIGKLLGEKGYIVGNGGYFGLMEAVSKGVQEGGGYAVGHLCDEVHKTSTGNEFLKHRIRSRNLCSRLELLLDDTKIFVVQKGSVGTLAEIMLVINVVTLKKDTETKMYIIGPMWKQLLTDVFKTLEVNYDFIIFCEDYKDFETKFENDYRRS